MRQRELYVAIDAGVQLEEACALLRDVDSVLTRVLDLSNLPSRLAAELESLKDQAQRLGVDCDGPPLAESIQKAQDFRLAVASHGFNLTNFIVATAWADMCTSLAHVFED